jgi:hypothetical protein
MVPAINQRNLYRQFRQSPGALQPAEPAAHHHHPRSLVAHAASWCGEIQGLKSRI